jgi:hypothetical protein
MEDGEICITLTSSSSSASSSSLSSSSSNFDAGLALDFNAFFTG